MRSAAAPDNAAGGDLPGLSIRPQVLPRQSKGRNLQGDSEEPGRYS